MKNNQTKRFQDVPSLLKQRNALPPSRQYLYDYKLEQALKDRATFSQEEFKRKFPIDFSDLPISALTLKALRLRKFHKMTEIQRCAIPHALAGRDILGASKTGSGKTLGYLVPLVEQLYIDKWSPLDGLGAIIILPTRELAMQVFEVFNSIGQFHINSVGLLIGGKNYQYEKERVSTMNVVICTPGRLLQHLEESPGFDANNLKILILDEADVMLEMGFLGALKAIMGYLPKEKQTMMFSATLTKSIHQLSQLTLTQPETILLHEQSETKNIEGPLKLQQFYLVTPIEEKVDVLFSFLKSHNKQKILIFAATCKQVRFLFEAFRKLKLGLPLLELHGRQKQDKRTAIFFTFAEKRAAALFTTNIASRGLDFPKIDWVIQFDCPEDVDTYVHRVGRTARYNAGGFSMLMLLPHEQRFAERLQEKGMEIKQKHLNSTKQLTIKHSLQSLVSENIDLKYLAQRAFISYVRSIDINADKEIFNVRNLKTDLLAESYGLIQVPVITVQEVQEAPKKSKLQKLKEKIEIKKQQALQKQQEIQETTKPLEVKIIKKQQRESDFGKFEIMKNKQQFDGEFLTRKKSVDNQSEQLEQPQFVTSKRQLKKVKSDGIFGGRNKVFFDEEGNQITAIEKRKQELAQNQDSTTDHTARYAQKLYEHAEEDKLHEIERRKEKRQKKKQIQFE